ncbi:hypothetical protein TUM12370_01720 [Salmonella enterica subsp. enterica serovar Choleraesuis]|nr:hypothetical protein TUM12370_01720 [Salmonella enterica subsp. enterica serovar Choleraesuis]
MKKVFIGAFAIGVCAILGYSYFSSYAEVEGYQTDIQAQPIEGITQNLSALTWNPETRTLFATINHPATVVELSTDGKLLRKLEVDGIHDPEAIEHIEGNRYVIADERQRHLYEVEITPQTQRLNVSDAPGLRLDMDGRDGNSGFEGLAWNRADKHLLVAQERKPIKLFKIEGFPALSGVSNVEIKVTTGASWMSSIGDISSLDYDSEHKQLLVMSEQSDKILFISPEKSVKQLTLDGTKHGLKARIPQPEGMATDGHGHLYIVSEPNLFYRLTTNTPDGL